MDPKKVNKKQQNVEQIITRVKNGSTDMILTPFDGKFNEKKDEMPPGICRPHMLHIFQYWGFGG